MLISMPQAAMIGLRPLSALGSEGSRGFNRVFHGHCRKFHDIAYPERQLISGVSLPCCASFSTDEPSGTRLCASGEGRRLMTTLPSPTGSALRSRSHFAHADVITMG
jgi:hypothetical protein